MNANQHLNLKANLLRTKLFELVNEFKDLQGAAHAASGDDAWEAASQIDGVACQLAEIHGNLPDVFTDVLKDDPIYSIPVQ